MNRHQLVEALLAAGRPPASFQVAGVHAAEPPSMDFWFMRPGADGGWDVGAFERGTYDVRKHFDAENQAAAFLYKALTGHEPPA